MWQSTTVLASALLLIALAARAQPTSTHPDSPMASGSGNSSANNGVGTSGSLNKQAGTASSSVKDMGGTAQLGDKASPTGKPSGGASSGDTKLETDTSQGGGKQHN